MLFEEFGTSSEIWQANEIMLVHPTGSQDCLVQTVGEICCPNHQNTLLRAVVEPDEELVHFG